MLYKTEVFRIDHSHSTSDNYSQSQNLSHHELDQPSVEHITSGQALYRILTFSKLKLIAIT